MTSSDSVRRPAAITRREALERAALGTLAAVLPLRLGAEAGRTSPGRPYLDAAIKAGAWLRTSAVTDGAGTRWPADPRDVATISLDLYNGTTGVPLFWLELHHATRDPDALQLATAGADWLAGHLTVEQAGGYGLYEGLAGTAFVLESASRASHERKYHDAARQAIALVRDGAHPDGDGVAWSDSTDIISGSAGIGLALLWAHRQLQDREALEMARRAGKQLVAAGVAEKGGMRWKINHTIPRNYPNFSHGTAGVSYFLASLHQATHDQTFLDAALAGARYLQAIATTTPGDGRMIFHSEPGNEQLYYLSWCHGPSGTARLFHRLGEITGDPSHGTYVRQLAAATAAMKVPERSPGFWNNVSQCCGNCGITEFLTSLHRISGDAAHLTLACTVADDALARATEENGGLKWTQAENRVSPEAMVAQTGLMQGAAGVGLALLHLDGAMNGRRPLIALPDNPWS